MDLRFSSSKLTSSCHQWQSNLQAPDCQHQKLGKGHFKGKKITVPSGEWEWSHIPTNGIHPQKFNNSPLKMDAWKTFPQKKGAKFVQLRGGGHRCACHVFCWGVACLPMELRFNQIQPMSGLQRPCFTSLTKKNCSGVEARLRSDSHNRPPSYDRCRSEVKGPLLGCPAGSDRNDR